MIRVYKLKAWNQHDNFFQPNQIDMKMDTQTVVAFLLLLAYPILSTSQTCSDSTCNPSDPFMKTIRFPFRLRRIQPRSCGYPGFELTCDNQFRTLMELPNSGQFAVQSIDYVSQEIWLTDPQECLPQRLLTLDLSRTPYRGVYNQLFSLFNCNASFDYRRFAFNPVTCLDDNSNGTIIATSSRSAVTILQENSCSLRANIVVPSEWPIFQQVWTTSLTEPIRLAWDTPNCGVCVSRGGRCGLRTSSDNQTICTNIGRGLPRGARVAIGMGVGAATFIFIMVLVCFCCKRPAIQARRTQETIEFTATVAPQPIFVTGLDGPTIESYPKTVLGESRRLPKPDDNICPICLCEYKPKETLRSIPACQHCFHADCIDEWLRLNATCPVCRNSPRQSPPV